MEYGDAISQSLLTLQLAQDRWVERAWPCCLLEGIDQPLAYPNIPDDFRAFAAWGVDGVHEGLWIGDPWQSHMPFVAMASPMDSESLILMASNVDEWLEMVTVVVSTGDFGREESFRARAATMRASMDLPPLPRQD